MKYIDAEKLIAEIRRIVEEETPISKGSDYYHGVANTADKLLSFITALQQEQQKSGCSEKPNNLLSEKQEQPELPGIEKPGIPGKDFIPVEWVDACERYGKWRIVKQEPSEEE